MAARLWPPSSSCRGCSAAGGRSVFALGATLTRDQQWANLIASMEYVNANPLPDNAPADTVQTRQLLVAALVRAENALQGSDQAAADAAYAQAQQAYQQFASKQRAAETPSGLALWLSGLGLDVAGPVEKIALGLGAVLVAVLIVPPLITAVAARRRA